MKRTDGFFRTVWVPKELDTIIEETRTKLGASRSSFYRNAVVRYLEKISVISAAVKDPSRKDDSEE